MAMDVGKGSHGDTVSGSRREGSSDNEDSGHGKEKMDGRYMDVEIEADASRVTSAAGSQGAS